MYKISIVKGVVVMNILFICTGNTCRSPIAEALFRNMIGDEPIAIQSAGIAASIGDEASAHAKQILINRQIEHQHASQLLTSDLVDWAHLVLTMTFSHKHVVLARFPESQGKVFTLKEYVTEDNEYETDKLLDWDIADPFGGNYDEYARTTEEIEQNLLKLRNKLTASEGNA